MPEELVWTSVTCPLMMLRIETLAPATAAPYGPVTVPDKVTPTPCAHRTHGTRRASTVFTQTRSGEQRLEKRSKLQMRTGAARGVGGVEANDIGAAIHPQSDVVHVGISQIEDHPVAAVIDVLDLEFRTLGGFAVRPPIFQKLIGSVELAIFRTPQLVRVHVLLMVEVFQELVHHALLAMGPQREISNGHDQDRTDSDDQRKFDQA